VAKDRSVGKARRGIRMSYWCRGDFGS